MWCHVLFFGFPLLGLALFWWLPLPLALALYAPLAALSVGAGIATVQAMQRPAVSGCEAMRGRVGRVEAVEGPRLTVRMDSELWNAVAEEPLSPGERVVVERVDGLTLTVRPVRGK